jgi:hypothetical protein
MLREPSANVSNACARMGAAAAMPPSNVYNLALHGQGDYEMLAPSGARNFGKAN